MFDLEIVPHKAKNMYMFLSLASVPYAFLSPPSTSFGSQHSLSKIASYACNVKW